MHRLALVLAGLALLTTGAWFLQDRDPDRPTALSGTENQDTDPDPVTSEAGENTPGLSAEQIKANLVAQQNQERRARDEATRNTAQEPTAIDYWADPEGDYFQIFHTEDMARLRWQKNTAKGRFVTAWFHRKVEVDARLFDDVEKTGDESQLAAMQAYNEFTNSKRRELVQAIGLTDANHVLSEFGIYNFDLEKRNWFRIDASGQKVPFLHPDHDIWENGENGGAPWSNHR